MACKLTRKAWLYRAFEVVTSEGWFGVTYDGRGMGYESVLVQDKVVVSIPSRAWFVPRFDFLVGSLPASIEVSVWLWLTLRSLTLRLNGRIVYQEPDPRLRPGAANDGPHHHGLRIDL